MTELNIDIRADGVFSSFAGIGQQYSSDSDGEPKYVESGGTGHGRFTVRLPRLPA